MSDPIKIVIIGGVAAGPKAAAKCRRLDQKAEITIIEKGYNFSYAGCGMPYYVSGQVSDSSELMETATGQIRGAEYFKNAKAITAMNRTEALSIDRTKKSVRIKNLETEIESNLEYDKLILGTGATPAVPPIEGIKLLNIHTLHSIEDCEAVKNLIDKGSKNAVIVGGGLIGMEMAEAFRKKGLNVTIVEMLPHILTYLDYSIAKLVENHLKDKGCTILSSLKVISFSHEDGSIKVSRVNLSDGNNIPADFVLIAAGVRPNSLLAKEAGLEIGSFGGIDVNEYMQTSDPDIYAAGDCVEYYNRLTRKKVFAPFGSTANRAARIAAINVMGGEAKFPGILTSSICKLFDYNIGMTGLSEREAKKMGYDVISCVCPAPDKPHFMPTSKPIIVKMIADKSTGKLLGVQVIGHGDVSKRVDVMAMALTNEMTAFELANVDLAYAPPFSPAMDNIVTAANVLENKRQGLMDGISAEEVYEKILNGEDIFLLDNRGIEEWEWRHLANSTLIPLGDLRYRLDEIPKDKEIIAYCKISLRGYEAALILESNGFENVKVMDGGLLAWPYEYETGV